MYVVVDVGEVRGESDQNTLYEILEELLKYNEVSKLGSRVEDLHRHRYNFLDFKKP